MKDKIEEILAGLENDTICDLEARCGDFGCLKEYTEEEVEDYLQEYQIEIKITKI